MSDTEALVDAAYDAIAARHGEPPLGSGPRRAWFRRHRAEMHRLVAEMRLARSPDVS